MSDSAPPPESPDPFGAPGEGDATPRPRDKPEAEPSTEQEAEHEAQQEADTGETYELADELDDDHLPDTSAAEQRPPSSLGAIDADELTIDTEPVPASSPAPASAPAPASSVDLPAVPPLPSPPVGPPATTAAIPSSATPPPIPPDAGAAADDEETYDLAGSLDDEHLADAPAGSDGSDGPSLSAISEAPVEHAAAPPMDIHASAIEQQRQQYMAPDDATCAGCGYALRGLHIEGDCPECGNAIANSLRGDYLRFADVAWLAKVMRGVLVLLISTAVGVLGGALVWVLELSSITTTMGTTTMDGGVVVVGLLVGVITNGLYVFGVFLFTEREPRDQAGDKGYNLRVIALASAIVGAVGSLVTVVGDPAADIASSWVAVIGYLVSLGHVVTTACIFMLAQKLANRVPNATLAQQCRVVMWGLTISMGLTFLIGMIAVLAMDSMGLAVLVGGSACISGVAVLVFFIWSIVVMLMLYGDLRRCHAAAKIFTSHMESKRVAAEQIAGHTAGLTVSETGGQTGGQTAQQDG